MLPRVVALMTMSVGVSFAKVPLREISEMAARIEELGWRERGRGDPWVASFAKQIPEGAMREAEAEVRQVVGEHWMNADEIRSLLRE